FVPPEPSKKALLPLSRQVCFVLPSQSCLPKEMKEKWCSKQTKNSSSGKQTKSNFNSLKTNGMLSFYNALVINTFFIASVILLHIWTKCEWLLLLYTSKVIF
uniref:Uncharacterized protein n=1 Tax=Cyanoderma ruficeps TaxID=181631 RepID=A0A8C3NXS8_9PASS